MILLMAVLCISEDLNPIFFLPGLMGSTLRGNVSQNRHWYCPKVMTNKQIWFNTLYTIPPFTNCILESIQMRINNSTNEINEFSGVNLDTEDFGGLEGISYVDSLFSIAKILPYFQIMINNLKKYGYKPNETLFGVPFDWRYGVLLPEKFWKDFQNLVEEKVMKTGKRAILIGHSTGCFVIQQFLTKYTTSKWRRTYIDSTILIAPSFGGSGILPLIQQTGFLGYIRDLAQLIGGVALQMPNYELNDKPISRDREGNIIKSRDIKMRLKQEGFLEGDKLAMFEKFEEVFSKTPESVDVPSTIIFNSGLVTPLGIDGKGLFPFLSKGDFMLNAEGFDKICQTWNNTECIDFRTSNPFASHLAIIWLKRTTKAIIAHINHKCSIYGSIGYDTIFHKLLSLYIKYIKKAPEFL